MEAKQLWELSGEESGVRQAKPSDFPSIDLYADQLLTILEESGTVLTKSMINNYSKNKLIQPVKGKKYTRAHILQLLLICRMKSTLSLEELRPVMERAFGMEEPVLASVLERGPQELGEELPEEARELAALLELCRRCDACRQAAARLAAGMKEEKAAKG